MTTQTTRDIGNKGETLACTLLKKRGFEVIDCNVSGRFGEIDIVAKKDKKYYFIEVRARSNLTFGTPAETVNGKKRLRLKKTIEYYCLQHSISDFQFDIIGIEIGGKITWYKNIPLI